MFFLNYIINEFRIMISGQRNVDDYDISAAERRRSCCIDAL